jgi:hypothetical protein
MPQPPPPATVGRAQRHTIPSRCCNPATKFPTLSTSTLTSDIGARVACVGHARPVCESSGTPPCSGGKPRGNRPDVPKVEAAAAPGRCRPSRSCYTWHESASGPAQLRCPKAPNRATPPADRQCGDGTAQDQWRVAPRVLRAYWRASSGRHTAP